MRRILRRTLTRDPSGRTLSEQSERLSDDGRGWLHVSSEQTAGYCSGCRRPIVELSELRGVCDSCHVRECCVHCLSCCQVCSRRLCGRCRHGFAGPPTITVCATCQQRLIQRQAMQDDLIMQQTAFDRDQAMHRQSNQDYALQLAEQRMRLMAQFQAARLGLNRQPPPLLKALHMLGLGVTKVVGYVRRALP